MAELLNGAPVAAGIKESLKKKLDKYEEIVGLGIIRMGEKPDDISYEKSIIKQADQIGIEITPIGISPDISSGDIVSLIEKLNRAENISGVLILRPMVNLEVEKLIVATLDPGKDVDGITSTSMAKHYSGHGEGFYPCTAEACMEILSYYGVNVKGKKVVIVGRSQVIGKPVAMMMLGQHATVTICHSKTQDLKETVRQADVVVAAIGRDRFITEEYLTEGQVVVDVGINFDQEGRLHGDVDFEKVKNLVKAITPVPGGVGNVTTALLFAHTVEASKRRNKSGEKLQSTCT